MGVPLVDKELRRLEEQADKLARKLARTMAELARVRAETAWSELTPEQRRARIREQSRRAGPAAAFLALLVGSWAALRRPEVALAAIAGGMAIGLGPSAGLGPAPPQPPDRPPVTAPSPPSQPAPEPSPEAGLEIHRPNPMDTRAVTQQGVAVAQPDDMPELPTLPNALPSPGPPELMPAPTPPPPSPGPTPTAAPEPPPVVALPPDYCVHLDLTLIDLTLCTPTLGSRS